MKSILIGLVILPIFAYGLTSSGNIVTLSDEEVTQCVANGGCVLVPKEIVLRYIASEIVKGTASCRNSI
jgi:hypothetical protein